MLPYSSERLISDGIAIALCLSEQREFQKPIPVLEPLLDRTILVLESPFLRRLRHPGIPCPVSATGLFVVSRAGMVRCAKSVEIHIYK